MGDLFETYTNKEIQKEKHIYSANKRLIKLPLFIELNRNKPYLFYSLIAIYFGIKIVKYFIFICGIYFIYKSIN